LTTSVHEAEKLSLEQIQAFLLSSEGIHFAGEKPEQGYRWMERVLCHRRYHQQGRWARGLVRRYLEKMTGLSRAQVTRLIGRYRKRGNIQALPYQPHRFPRRYTRADLEPLATVDEAHENLSGPATRRILEQEYREYGKLEYERLAFISVAHLYNLRKQPRYRERRFRYIKTRPLRWPSENGGDPIRKAGPVFCGSTPCTKAIRREATACFISMPHTSEQFWRLGYGGGENCCVGCYVTSRIDLPNCPKGSEVVIFYSRKFRCVGRVTGSEQAAFAFFIAMAASATIKCFPNH
jgi:transposase